MSDSVSRSRFRGDRDAMVPPAEPRTYYDRPILKEPVWTWEVPLYFFTGGMAGAASLLASFSRLRGNAELAQRSRAVAAVAGLASPPLLVADLGVPRRFLNMLRVFKVTSPLSTGSWVLAGFVPAAVGSALLARWGRLPGLQAAAEAGAAFLGPAMSTYTAVLVADTAIPVWQEARRELPAVFAGGSAASAGAAALLLTDPRSAGPARRIALAGAAAELAASKLMERRLGELAQPYHEGVAGGLDRAARALTLAGALLVAGSGRSRSRGRVGATLLLAGALAKRWAVFRAGFQSARDPRYVVGPQRRRMREREADGSL